MEDGYPHFLAAKRLLDERSINLRIWQRFVGLASDLGRQRGHLRILEIGPGLGATACRVIESMRGIPVEYHLIDLASSHLSAAGSHVLTHLHSAGYKVNAQTESLIEAERDHTPLRIVLLNADATSPDVRSRINGFDVLIGQALLDLVDVDEDLDAFLSFLKPGSVFYFPITYDGLTYFGPQLEAQQDERVVCIYNHSMDERARVLGRAGGSRTGRLVLERLRPRPLGMLDVGSSDWVVFSGSGGYAEDEIAFLSEILDFVEKELMRSGQMQEEAAADWVRKRREQLVTGELIYLSHQLDFVGQLL